MAYGRLIKEMGSNDDSQYGFVNETQVRVGANIMFTIGFFTLMSTMFAGWYMFALVVVSLYRLDFLLKVINPKYSYIGYISGILVSNKAKVWVGAVQKRFAWSMGLVFSSIVLLALIRHNFFSDGVNHYLYTNQYIAISPAMILCVICLILMWLEGVLGYCVGCQIYGWLTRHNFMTKKDHQTCPDGICSL